MSQNPTNFKGAYPPFLNDPITGGVLVTSANFAPSTSAILAATTSSTSVTFTRLNPSLGSLTVKITNKGTAGAYIGWGTTTATAVTSSATPAANCDYVAAGAILTQDFWPVSGTTTPIDTIAAIREGSTSTTLEITIGYGQ